ncbi:hypothetical protein CC78DRAFT_614476 [Lojkania enalia]|uniref:Uncharacterized protein n=1 Tax=Lojkania enalia TaxID=147567 RepID=A0A9P4N8X2_9PLEO|nr:hypothetical protein CC78DRAFT_614476 [Didymosphaeria enalia]
MLDTDSMMPWMRKVSITVLQLLIVPQADRRYQAQPEISSVTDLTSGFRYMHYAFDHLAAISWSGDASRDGGYMVGTPDTRRTSLRHLPYSLPRHESQHCQFFAYSAPSGFWLSCSTHRNAQAEPSLPHATKERTAAHETKSETRSNAASRVSKASRLAITGQLSCCYP